MICTWLCPCHFRVRVGDSLWWSKEIVKNLKLCLWMRLLLLHLHVINSLYGSGRQSHCTVCINCHNIISVNWFYSIVIISITKLLKLRKSLYLKLIAHHCFFHLTTNFLHIHPSDHRFRNFIERKEVTMICTKTKRQTCTIVRQQLMQVLSPGLLPDAYLYS